MPPELSDGPIAIAYAILILFGSTVVVPDPTWVLSLLVAIVGVAVVGYALLDGSLRALGWGIAALYAVGTLLGTYLVVRRRGPPADLPLVS